MQSSLKQIVDYIKNSKNIIILSHVGSDGDSIGSTLALKEILEQQDNIDMVDAVIVGKVPDLLSFLPDIDSLQNIQTQGLLNCYDLAIALDCGSIDRLGDSVDFFRNAKKTISIDHHMSNTNFAAVNMVNSQAAATAEIVFDLIAPLNVKLNKNIAINLYTGILTDTGCFKFDKTNPKTFEICSELLKTGMDPGYVQKQYYESKPIAMFRLHSMALAHTKFICNDKVAYTVVTKEMLNEAGATEDHTEGIGESLRTIKGIEVSIVFRETNKGITKASFRSNKVNVCEIASFFGGGGHMLAAGCNVEKKPYEAAQEVLEIVKKRISVPC